MRYPDYLRSPHWIGFRKRYKNERPWECAAAGCEKRKYLDLHHLTYERIGQEELDDVIPLCREHHTEAHLLEIFGGESLSKAHLCIGEAAEDVTLEQSLFFVLMEELGLIVFGVDDYPYALNRKEAKRLRQRVTHVSAEGVRIYGEGVSARAVTRGCVEAIRADDAGEVEAYIYLAQIEMGEI